LDYNYLSSATSTRGRIENLNNDLDHQPMNEPSTYTPPQVWQPDTDPGGTWSKINRPVAGATHEQELPVGNHPLQLYSLATPNGQKVTILLEELLDLGIAGAEYDAYPIKINEGDQFGSGFVALNPNSKIPALIDRKNGYKPRPSRTAFLL
jgi:GST-like protein